MNTWDDGTANVLDDLAAFADHALSGDLYIQPNPIITSQALVERLRRVDVESPRERRNRLVHTFVPMKAQL